MLAAIRRVQIDVKTVLSGDSPELEALTIKVKSLDRLKRAVHAFSSTSSLFIQQLQEVNDAVAAVYPVNQPLSSSVAALWRGEESALHFQALQASVDESVTTVTAHVEDLRSIFNQHHHLQGELAYYHDKLSKLHSKQSEKDVERVQRNAAKQEAKTLELSQCDTALKRGIGGLDGTVAHDFHDAVLALVDAQLQLLQPIVAAAQAANDLSKSAQRPVIHPPSQSVDESEKHSNDVGDVIDLGDGLILPELPPPPPARQVKHESSVIAVLSSGNTVEDEVQPRAAPPLPPRRQSSSIASTLPPSDGHSVAPPSSGKPVAPPLLSTTTPAKPKPIPIPIPKKPLQSDDVIQRTVSQDSLPAVKRGPPPLPPRKK